MEIPIPPDTKYQEQIPDTVQGLSWEDIQPALHQGKKCRRLAWREDLYIKMNKSEAIHYYCTSYFGEKISVCAKDVEGASLDTICHDWVIIDKHKK